MAAVPRRILGAQANGPTRRNLFGPVDREQLRAEYQAALSKDLEDASRRWSFDFLSEKPLSGGDYQWEGVSGTRVPFLYRSCLLEQGAQRGGRASEEARSPSLQSDKENVPLTPERRAGSPEKTPQKLDRAGQKRKQTNITDFYQTKRRFVLMPRKSGQ